MKTALLITGSNETQQLLGEMFGQEVNFILVNPPAEASRHGYDELYASWMRMTDMVVLDAVSLGEATRWAVEALEAVTHSLPVAVAVLATPMQQTLYSMSDHWLVITETHSVEAVRKSLRTFLELHDTKSKLQRSEAVLARQRRQSVVSSRGATAAVTGAMDWVRYRDALKNMSRLLGSFRMGGDRSALLSEFARMVRELLGVGKLAIFVRRYQKDFSSGRITALGNDLTAVICEGIGAKVIEHVRLSASSGVGGFLVQNACILRRELMSDPSSLDFDPQIAREFHLLGTEAAVPMFDEDQLTGVLTLSGRVTGEPLSNDDLELLWHLMDHLGVALRNLHLLEQVGLQQRFMNDVFEHVQSGVVAVGRGGRILSVNRRARELLNLGDADVTGQSIGRLPSPVASAIFEALQTGHEVADRGVTLPRSGRPLSVSATRFAARLEADEPDKTNLVAVGVIDDLTQIRLQSEHERAMSDRAFFMRLASRLSHELKNSLVSIKIFSQLLPARYGEKEFRDQFSGTVVNEVNRIDSLVNNLTFFAHPLALVCEPLVLTELLDTCVNNVSQDFARKQAAHVMSFGEKPSSEAPSLPLILVKRNLAHKLARIEGDKIRLMQAFEHVIRNAVQGMLSNQHEGWLSVSTAEATAGDLPGGKLPEGGAVKIEINDNGEGIPLENLKRVTEPFMTTRNVGVGLGLTIVKKIVEQHGGVLSIDSMLGRGTTVRIVLPARAQSVPAEQGAADMTATGGVATDDAHRREPTPMDAEQRRYSTH